MRFCFKYSTCGYLEEWDEDLRKFETDDYFKLLDFLIELNTPGYETIDFCVLRVDGVITRTMDLVDKGSKKYDVALYYETPVEMVELACFQQDFEGFITWFNYFSKGY